LFPDTCRIVQRWFAAHMFSTCISPEAVELLTASVFSNPQPYTAPVSAFAGLQRVLLRLAQFEWLEAPLIVDYTGEMTVQQRTQILNSFREVRFLNTDQAAMFVATARDPSSKNWTWSYPSQVELARIVTYASSSSAALVRLTEKTFSGDVVRPANWMSVFKTPLSKFDALIHLDTSVLPSYSRLQALFSKAVPQSSSPSDSSFSSSVSSVFSASSNSSSSSVSSSVSSDSSSTSSSKRAFKAPPGGPGSASGPSSSSEDGGDRPSKKARKDQRKDQRNGKSSATTTTTAVVSTAPLVRLPLIGFSPVACFLRELRSRFGKFAHFYYDSMGGDVIGVMWRPEAMVPAQPSTSNTAYAAPLGSREAFGHGVPLDAVELHQHQRGVSHLVSRNVLEIRESWRTLGRGLVLSISPDLE